MRSSRAVLVVGPSWVGDMVMAQSLFMQLKRDREDIDIDVLAPTWSLPVIARMPEVRRGIALDVAHGELAWTRRRALAHELREIGYAQAIILPRSLKAALVPFFARIPRRTGYRGEHRYWLINDMRRFDPALLDQTVKRFVGLGLDAGMAPDTRILEPRLRTEPRNWRRLAARFGIDDGRRIVAIMPGAEYGPAKRWPAERFARLAKSLTDAGLKIVILGSEKERDIAAEIVRGTQDAVDLCGRTELVDVIDVLAAASVAVSNDSGLLHIAAAVGTHVIAIYGSSTPDFTPPLTEAKTTIYLGLPCSPCFARTCPLTHLACLMSIDVSTVEKSVLAALARE